MKTETEASVAEMTDEERELAAAMEATPDLDLGPEPEPKSLEALAAEEPDEQDGPEQFRLFGTAPKLNTSVKGVRVTGSAISFKAAGQPMPGQFDHDAVFRVVGLARVDNVSFPAKRDNAGNVIGVTRKHHVTLVEVTQVGEVPTEFAENDGRDATALENEQLRARVAELEAQLG